MKIKYILKTMLMFYLIGGSICQANELKNSGFEGDWLAFGNAYIEDVQPRSGEWHGKLFGNWTDFINYSGMYQDIEISSGKGYIAEMYALNPSSDPMSSENRVLLKLEFYASDKELLLTVESPYIDSGVYDTYEHISVQADAPEGTTSARIIALFEQVDYNDGSISIDDITLNRTSIPENQVITWSRTNTYTMPYYWKPNGGFWTLLGQNIPTDLSDYKSLDLFLYSEYANGQILTIAITSENHEVSGWNYFYHHLTVDWTGWKDISLSFKDDFKSARSPFGWHKIDGINIHSYGWGHSIKADTELYFDISEITP